MIAPVPWVKTPPPAPPALAPPSLAPVEKPKTRRSYASRLMLVDLPVILTFLPAMDAANDDDSGAGIAVAIGYAAVYLIVPPLFHDAAGNHAQADRSIARRLGYPALGLLGGFAIGAAGGGNCEDLCGVVGGLAGAGIGTVLAAVVDWAKAYVER